MKLVKTLLLFLVLEIKGRHLLQKLMQTAARENGYTKQRGSKHSFGSIVSQLTELKAPSPKRNVATR